MEAGGGWGGVEEGGGNFRQDHNVDSDALSLLPHR